MIELQNRQVGVRVMNGKNRKRYNRISIYLLDPKLGEKARKYSTKYGVSLNVYLNLLIANCEFVNSKIDDGTIKTRIF